MYGIFLKEMGMVKHFMKLHPATTLLDGSVIGISNTIKPCIQNIINYNCYLNDPDQF